MSKRNVYMIDDNPAKQQWLIEFLKAANDKARKRRLGVTLIPAFGNDADAASVIATNPDKIWQALHDSDGIYLVNLGLPPEARGLIDKIFRASEERLAKATVTYYDELVKKGGQAAQVLHKYPVAPHILHYCKLTNKPTLYVSTDVIGSDTQEIVNCGLAKRVDAGFPNQPLDQYATTEKERYIEGWSERILALLDPWDRVADATRDWFTKNIGADWKSFEADGLPHDLGLGDGFSLEGHKESVKAVFDWCPDTWWADRDKARALNECLKTVVGAHAQWMGFIRNKPLSLGGAYLVFLMAVAQKAPQQVQKFCIDDWRCFCSKTGVPIPFLGSQDQDAARRSLRALYAFFLQIVLRKDDTTPGIKELKGPSPGHPYFSIKLDWLDEDLGRLAQGVRAAVTSRLDPQPNQPLGGGNTVSALLRFIYASKVGVSGFGALGTIRLDDDPNKTVDKRRWLRVGQYEAIQ